MTEHDTIKLFMIRIDGGTQSRASLSESTIEEYVEAITNGATFPPVTIFHDDSSYWLSEGFHRFHAHERAGRESIACDIRQGTRRDAVLFAAGANAEHGLRRTNEDKRRAVMMLLGDDEWRGWSDREVARRCGVSPPFVSSLRLSVNGLQIAASDNGSQIERTVDRGGSVYTMKTTGINAPRMSFNAALKLAKPNEYDKQTAPLSPAVDAVIAGQSAVAEKADRYFSDQDRRLNVPAPEPSAKPLRDLVGISGGELARWVKQTTPNDRTHVIRVLEMAAGILRDELQAGQHILNQLN
jgi:uncharacterized ParB-like nuclease family protein